MCVCSTDLGFSGENTNPGFSVGKREHMYKPLLYVCDGVPYRMDMFSVPRQRALSVLRSVWCVVACLAPDSTQCGIDGYAHWHPYWPVRSIGRKHADEHAWRCLTSYSRGFFAVRLWYYCSLSNLVFLRYVARNVSKSFAVIWRSCCDRQWYPLIVYPFAPCTANRNFDVSVIYTMLIQQTLGIVMRGVTPALSLRCTSS